MADSISVGATDSSEESIPLARPPNDDERKWYYSGVEGTLLARTSTHELPARYPFPPKKQFATIGQHPILSAWSSSLVQSIRAALVEIDWIRFYPIRLGYPDSKYMIESVPRDELILLVDVLPGTTTWEPGFAAASKCRQLLRQAGLSDVEVELRVVEPRPHVGHLRQRMDSANWDLPQAQWMQPYLKSATSLNEFLSSGLPDFVGFEISTQWPYRGTMGPIIELVGRPSELYGLTCRHVVCDLKVSESSLAPNHEQYTADDVDPEHRRFVTAPSREMWIHAADTMRQILKHGSSLQVGLMLRQTRSMWDPDRYKFSEQEEVYLASLLPQLEYCQELLDFLEAGEMQPSVIGHLAFMPPLAPMQSGFLRDWALIRLDEAKIDPLPVNKVLVDIPRLAQLNAELNDEYNSEEHSLKLSGLLSCDKSLDRKAIPVAKRGIKTGFTFGTTNEIKAVVRIPAGDPELCWEWIVVADTLRQQSGWFSDLGDSGSCVFARDGRVVGLLTGGYKTVNVRTPATRKPMTDQDTAAPLDPGPANYKEILEATASESSTIYHSVPDLTFVTPIDYLFDDIRRVTGCEPRLAGETV